MSFLIVLIIILFLAFMAIQDIKKEPPEKRRKKLVQYGIYTLIAVIGLLVVTGRMHWVAAAIAALIPALQKLFFIAIRFFPFLSQIYRHKNASEHSDQNPQNSTKMDLQEALKIYGFDKAPTNEKEIIQRHRELMQKIHPDRGGSDYLAAQINTAKEILINQVSR